MSDHSAPTNRVQPIGADEQHPPSGHSGQNGHGGNGHAPVLIPGLNAPVVAAAPKPAARAAAAQGDLTLTEAVSLLRTGVSIVRSRWWLGLIAALLVGGGIGFLVFRMPTEHTAVTTLLATSTLDQILRTDGASGASTNTQEQENILRNHLSVMKSRRFTVQLASAFSDEEMKTIMAPYLPPGAVATRAEFELYLAGGVNAERERGREFFTLSFSHRDPDIALLVADRISASYLKLVQDEFRQANVSGADLLRKQASELQSEISSLEDERRDYRKEHNIISVEENQGILGERLRRIDMSRGDVRMQRVRLESQLAEAREAMEESTMPFDNPLLAGFGNNPALRQELDRLNAQREVLATRYGPNHPKMRDLDSSIRGVRENIVKNFDLAYRDLQSQFEAAKVIEDQLTAEFAQAFQDGIEIEKLANRYLLLGAEVAAKRETLTDLLRRVNAASLISQLPANVMQVVDPAYLDQPRLPKKVLFGAFAVVVALGAFVGLPLTLHLFDQRIKGATDVEKELGKELIGGVPRLNKIRPEDRAHIVRDNTDPGNVEAFMAIVAQLELSTSRRGYPKTLLITSTIPGEGKSTITSNLAAGFTRLGKKVLILDFDFRRPTQHLVHRIVSDKGFLAWARAGYPQDDLFGRKSLLGVQELADGTHLIPAGGDDPQPTQYFVAKPTAALLAELKHRYDVILIDTPPSGLFQDALVLARFAQDTILVAREAKAPVAQIKHTVADIDKTAAPVLGVVLNGFSAHSLNPRLAYGYSYGNYGYGATAGKKQRAKRTASAAA